MITELQSRIDMLQEKLRDYEEMEKVAEENQDENQDPANQEFKNPYFISIYDQTRAQRKKAPPMNLAQRLKSQYIETKRLARMLADRKAEIEALQKELSELRALFNRDHKPEALLLERVEERDKEIKKYNRMYDELKLEKHLLLDQYNKINDLYKEAKRDIDNLIIKRNNLLNIQSMLQRMAASNPKQF